MYANNPFGTDAAESQDKQQGSRIGRRIKKIREEHIPKMSQAQLGEAVGLPQQRIHQYENGERKPRLDVTQKIAEALGVSTSAIADPDTTSYTGVMYALFELEDLFGLRIKEMDGKIYFYFEERRDKLPIQALKDNIHAWLDVQKETQAKIAIADTAEDKERALHEYHQWEWTFPNCLADKSASELEKLRLKEQIKAMQDRLQKLEDDELTSL